jgi:hypothetical protein
MAKSPKLIRGTPRGTLRSSFGFTDNRYGVDDRSPIKPRYHLKPGEFAKYSSLEREAWASELLEHAIYLIAWLTPKKKRVTQAVVRKAIYSFRDFDADGVSALAGLSKVLSILDDFTRPRAPGPKRFVPLNEALAIEFGNKVPRGRHSKRTLEDDIEFLSDFEAEKIRQRAEGNSRKSNEKICVDWAALLLHGAYESQAGPQGISGKEARIIRELAPLRGKEWATTIRRAQARIRTQKRRLRGKSVTKPNS